MRGMVAAGRRPRTLRYAGRPMHLRLLELRLLAALLFALWAIAALAIVGGYHPGRSPDLLVRASAVLPALIAAVALVWPPFARGPRAAALTGWLAVGSALVLAPSIGELLPSIAAEIGRRRGGEEGRVRVCP